MRKRCKEQKHRGEVKGREIKEIQREKGRETQKERGRKSQTNERDFEDIQNVSIVPLRI